jgi:hypothetical protein
MASRVREFPLADRRKEGTGMKAPDVAAAPEELKRALRDGLAKGTTALVSEGWMVAQLPGRRVLAFIVEDDLPATVSSRQTGKTSSP